MNLHKVTATNSEGQKLTTWGASQTDASQARKKYNSEMGIPRNSIQSSVVDVPTSKGPLIDFLNKLEGGE